MEYIFIFLLFCVYTISMLILTVSASSPSKYEVNIHGPVKLNVKLENNNIPKLLENTISDNIIDAEYTESENINYNKVAAIKSYTALEDKQEQKIWSRYI